MENPQPVLPPGFRFHPTDEELILHYLQKKVSSIPLSVSIIADVDIYKFNPWDLPAMAAFGEKEWYFFSPRDRKYPNGARPNRAAASGYWKATGTDKVITGRSPVGARSENIGVKKALVFYKGRPPKGTKTNWIMHEYRLTESPSTLSSNNRPLRLRDSPMRLDHWVLCRIYKKLNVLLPPATTAPMIDQDRNEEQNPVTARDSELPSNNMNNTLATQKSASFSNLLDATDYAMLSSFLSDAGNQPNSLSFLEEPSSALAHSTAPGGLVCHDHPSAEGSSSPVVGSALKGQLSGIEAEKRFPGSSTCSFQTSGAAQFDVPGQYNCMINHSFLNQQLLLGPNVQFLG